MGGYRHSIIRNASSGRMAQGSFSGLVRPLVYSNQPLINPSVAVNKPSVGYKGFTLIELIAVLTIVGILTALAVPSFRNFLLDNRIRSQTSDLVTALNFARSTAVAQHAPVSVCSPTAPGGTACGGVTSWNNGWIVTTNPAGGIPPLRTEAQASEIAIVSTPANTVTFGMDGTLQLSGSNEVLTVCDNVRTGERGRLITIIQAGSAVVSDYVCN